jgi:hypothetical protein
MASDLRTAPTIALRSSSLSSCCKLVEFLIFFAISLLEHVLLGVFERLDELF